MISDRSPAQLVLMSSVARRHYLDGRSKTEIADEFGLSRFKVRRLLDAARSTGMVRIEVRHDGIVDVELSARLRDRFGLRHSVVVIDLPGSTDQSVRRDLARCAADLLAEVITADDVLGLGWTRVVTLLARVPPRLPGTPVVQLTGVLSIRENDETSVDIVRDVARASGGPAYVFYTPLVVPDAVTAGGMRRQPEVARAFGMLPSVTLAIVGIGLWTPELSLLHGAATAHELSVLRHRKVCAEVSGVFLTPDGEPVRAGLTDRMIAPTAEQLRAIPEVLSIAHDPARAPAVHAALRAGLVGSLVTHAALARRLLEGRPA